MKKTKMITTLTALILTLAMTAGFGLSVTAEQDGEEKTQPTELEQFIADWGESYEGVMGAKDYTLDFEDYEKGTDFSAIEDWSEIWNAANATGDYITAIAETKGNKYLRFAPFSQMFLEEGITGKYVFSFDMKANANQGFGAFFRTTGEQNINPYYEDDRSGFDILGIGPNGIYIVPNDKMISVFIKFYDEKKSSDKNGKYLNNKRVNLKISDNFSARFVRVSVADYGTGAKIFANGELVGTLEFSDIVSGYDEMFSEYSFYSTVKVIDSAGNEKATVNNALVCSDMSVLAFGMRINDGSIDNVTISEYPEAISSVELDGTPKTNYFVGDSFEAAGAAIVTKYESGKTKRMPVTADMLEGFDTSSAGTKTVKIVAGDKEFSFDIVVSEKSADPTDKPADGTAAPTAGEDQPKATSESGAAEDDEKGGANVPLIVGLVAGGVIIAGIAVVLVILKMKSRK